MHLAWVFVEKWPQVLRRPRRFAPPEANMAANAAQATQIGLARYPKAQILLQLHRFRPPPAAIASQKLRFCDSYADSSPGDSRMDSEGARLGVMAFRALLQFAPAGASVASAGAELRPRDKLFGFVAAVAASGPLLTSGRLGPRMQSFSEASAAALWILRSRLWA